LLAFSGLFRRPSGGGIDRLWHAPSQIRSKVPGTIPGKVPATYFDGRAIGRKRHATGLEQFTGIYIDLTKQNR
jgi:hypothetical protein